jgi:Fur family transcriptional regulator, zinc uptake regulator
LNKNFGDYILAAHHHSPSVEKVLEKTERYLSQQGGRMTCVRREIVARMVELGEPKTAYKILDAANKKRKVKLSAISVYRTLDFLMDAGVVLKLESKNAFQLCLNGKPEHGHLMMICDKCGHVREIEDRKLSTTLANTAKKNGHRLKHHVIELHGVCRSC